jgi:ribosomal protein S12 methylthiotransferase accessory factor
VEQSIAEHVPKRIRAGTHRSRLLEQTYTHAQQYMHGMGITRIADITGLDRIGIPVVAVMRPNGRSLSVSQGKGRDLMAARVSGLMEAIESWHAEHIRQPLLLGSYYELRQSHLLLDPADLPQDGTKRWHPDLTMLWIEGVDLIGACPIWVPYDQVQCDYTPRGQALASGLICSSNGLASGNHLQEAIVHALWELIERDARALWRLRSAADREQRRIDPASVADPDCQALFEQFAAAGVAMALWDLSIDTAIPVVRCQIVDREDHHHAPIAVASGYGCHASRAIALQRACTEAAQARLTMISGSRDDLMRRDYQRLGDPQRLTRTRQRILTMPTPWPYQAIGQSWEADTFAADIHQTLQHLLALGIAHVVAVNLTHPTIGIPVVKMVVPGLAHTPTYLSGVVAAQPMARYKRWLMQYTQTLREPYEHEHTQH